VGTVCCIRGGGLLCIVALSEAAPVHVLWIRYNGNRINVLMLGRRIARIHHRRTDAGRGASQSKRGVGRIMQLRVDVFFGWGMRSDGPGRAGSTGWNWKRWVHLSCGATRHLNPGPERSFKRLAVESITYPGPCIGKWRRTGYWEISLPHSISGQKKATTEGNINSQD
jgi:hypothetical protein